MAVGALALMLAAALGFAELAAEVVSPFAGALGHALLVGLLALLLSMHRDRFPLIPGRWDAPRQVEALLLVFMTISVIRLLSLTLPVESIPRIWWFVGAGLPGLLAVGMLARATRLSGRDLGLQSLPGLSQLAVALSGLPLGYLGHVWVEPTPLLEDPDLVRLAAYCLVLAVFSAALEELLFRGAMQPAAVRLFGGYGVLYTALIFALLYIGSRSPQGILLAFLAGGLFGLARQRTGALWGVIAAHAVMTAGMLVVFPVYL
jgi:hypothetical protein